MGDCIENLIKSLKINQSSWTSLLSRTLSQAILSSKSLKRPRSALLMSRVVLLLFALFFPLGILNSIMSLSLQPRVPLTFISPTSPLLFIKMKSSRASSFVGSLMTCVRQLPSIRSCNLLGCLYSAALPFQQLSGWFKFPCRPGPVTMIVKQSLF